MHGLRASSDVAHGRVKSLVAWNCACCLVATLLFSLHTLFSTGRMYGDYAAAISLAIFVVIAGFVAVAVVLVVFGFATTIAKIRRHGSSSLREVLFVWATLLLPFPAMVLTIRIVSEFAKSRL